MELQSKTSVLYAGQTSAFLQEMLAFLMLDKPVLFSESPLIEQRKNVGWKREAHSFFNPERLYVA